MSFEHNFCSSPWLHMRINNAGNYEYCRWATKDHRQREPSIADIDPIEWFQQNMSAVREAMLNGGTVPGCAQCHGMEQHGKVSGRQRQLLKIGVRTENFAPSLRSSTWIPVFESSQANQGRTDQYPQDWQIDLGNYCNSACLFCSPFNSTKLAVEHHRLGMIEQMPARAWCDDPVLLEKFISALKRSPRLTYLHFIGGETLITPAFKQILVALKSAGLNQQVTLGFTTNLTVWRDDVVDLLTQFYQVNLGMSVECLHPVNDYVRYGGDIDTTQRIMSQWLAVAQQHNWFVQLRITPTILTVQHLDTIYDYARTHDLAVESCNFIDRPEFMRPTVLPREYRLQFAQRLLRFADQTSSAVVNTRDPSKAQIQTAQDAVSYIHYLSAAPDESHRLPDLVKYLKQMESLRGNSVLDYAPEYEELFRSAGY